MNFWIEFIVLLGAVWREYLSVKRGRGDKLNLEKTERREKTQDDIRRFHEALATEDIDSLDRLFMERRLRNARQRSKLYAAKRDKRKDGVHQEG